jgi:hypothetical protein
MLPQSRGRVSRQLGACDFANLVRGGLGRELARLDLETEVEDLPEGPLEATVLYSGRAATATGAQRSLGDPHDQRIVGKSA